MNKDLALITSRLEGERWMEILAALCLIILGGGTVYHFFGDNHYLVLVGLGIGTGGFYYQAHLANKPLILPKLIAHRSRRIVWVYSMVTRRMPFGLQFSQQVSIYFRLLDGDQMVVAVREREVEELMKTLNRYLPHATFGYSKDNEQWYLADPAMMYRDDR